MKILEVYCCFRVCSRSSDINNPSTSVVKEETEMLQSYSLHRTCFQRKLPSIWKRACHGRGIHTSAYSLPQHPSAIPSKINTQLFHHRPRFTTQSLMSVLASNVTVINHLPYSIKVSRGACAD